MTIEQAVAQMEEMKKSIDMMIAKETCKKAAEAREKNTTAAEVVLEVKPAAVVEEVKPAAPATSLFFKLGSFFALSQKAVVEATETTTQAVKDGYHYSVKTVEEAATELVAGYKGTSK
jgi:hypothetical protein